MNFKQTQEYNTHKQTVYKNKIGAFFIKDNNTGRTTVLGTEKELHKTIGHRAVNVDGEAVCSCIACKMLNNDDIKEFSYNEEE